MGWKFGPYWEEDSHDREMQSRGYLPDCKAAEILGVTVAEVRSLVRGGELNGVREGFACFVSQRAIGDRLASHGKPSPIWREIDRLERAGNHRDAHELRCELQRAANADGLLQRLGAPPILVERSAPTPVHELISEFTRRFPEGE